MMPKGAGGIGFVFLRESLLNGQSRLRRLLRK
jgi:hypothetical protein